jgi:hypothetical protein
VGQVTGVEHERRRLGRGRDLGNRLAKRRRDVGVRRLVESDVTVADLDEPQRAGAMGHRRHPRRLPER